MTDATHMRLTLGTAIHALSDRCVAARRSADGRPDLSGLGLIAFGVGLKGRASRHSGKPAAV